MKLKATLIQDIGEYLVLLKSYLKPLIGEHNVLAGMTEEDILQWIVEEELELVYCLFTRTHQHNKWPHTFLHDRLDKAMPLPLSKYTSHYIKAPKLYGAETVVKISIKHDRDLYIEYHAPFVSIAPAGFKFNQF